MSVFGPTHIFTQIYAPGVFHILTQLLGLKHEPADTVIMCTYAFRISIISAGIFEKLKIRQIGRNGFGITYYVISLGKDSRLQ